VVLFRMGYIDKDAKRPTIDWSSPQRKGVSELAFAEEWGEALPELAASNGKGHRYK
jgi:hypothetical protein